MNRTLLALLLASSTVLADAKTAAKERAAAQKLLKKGDKAGAAAAFRRATQADPSDIGSFNDLAFVLIGLEKLEEAKAASEQALRVPGADEGRRAAAWYNLGRAREGLQDADAAREAYLSSLELRFSKDAVARATVAAGPEQVVKLINALVALLGRTGSDEKAQGARDKILASLDEQVWSSDELLRALTQAPPNKLKGVVHGTGAKDVLFISFDTHNGGTMRDMQLHVISCEEDGCAHHAHDTSADYNTGYSLGQGMDRYLLLSGSDAADSCHGEDFAELWEYDPGTRAYKRVEGAFPKGLAGASANGARVGVEWSCEGKPQRDDVMVRLLWPEGSVCLTKSGADRKLKRTGAKFAEAGPKC